jgi:hypothetical protein
LPFVDEQVLASVDDRLPVGRLEPERVAADLPGDALAGFERQLFELDLCDPGLETRPPIGCDRLPAREQLRRRREQLCVIRVHGRSRSRIAAAQRGDEVRPRAGNRAVVHG